MCGEQRQRNAQIHYLESQKQGKNIHIPPFLSTQHTIIERNRQTFLSVSEKTNDRQTFVFYFAMHKLCLYLVDSDLVDCRDTVDYFCYLTDDRNGQIIS